MTLNVKAPDNIILKPVITVFGVGGAGGNAVNNMIKSHLQGASFVVANTDAQVLECSECQQKIQLGMLSTKGLGAGASPDVGRAAAEESEDEIRAYLENSNMVFITAGMGGGTGTGASPVIARIAKELGILTVGVVTKPFLFEGAKRMRIAEFGLAELQNFVDTLIVIPNQNLFRIANEHTTFTDAFKMADEVLHAGVRGVTDLITMPGLINLDFADIKTVMSEMGKAMMGTGEASGEERAIKAAEAAIANPLLDHSSMCGASGVLINITGGRDMTLYEVDSAANRIREEVGDSDANIIFGSTFNPDLEGIIRVSVVATGIDSGVSNKSLASNDIPLEEHKTSKNKESSYLTSGIFGNVSIDELKPPSFDEQLVARVQEQETSNELRDKLKKLVEMVDSERSENHNEARDEKKVLEEVGSTSNHYSREKPSLFKRMWNSLKSQDQIDEYDQSHSYSEPRVKHSANAEDEGDGYVRDMPTFLRKKK